MIFLQIKHAGLDRSTLSLSELCQKLTYTMHTNFDNLKMHVLFLSLKNQVAQKLYCNSASKQRKPSCEVPNKTYIVCDSYKITYCDIKAPGFSKLSIQIAYIFLKHPVYDHRISDISACLTVPGKEIW